MFRKWMLAVLLVTCSALLSAVPIGPEMTLNHNALQAPKSARAIALGERTVRIDQGAQVSSVYTSLMPAALEFGTMDESLDATDGIQSPKDQILNVDEARPFSSVTDFLATTEDDSNVVAVIGMALPNPAVIADIARLSDPLEPNGSSEASGRLERFPAASILSLALSQKT